MSVCGGGGPEFLGVVKGGAVFFSVSKGVQIFLSVTEGGTRIFSQDVDASNLRDKKRLVLPSVLWQPQEGDQASINIDYCLNSQTSRCKLLGRPADVRQ